MAVVGHLKMSGCDDLEGVLTDAIAKHKVPGASLAILDRGKVTAVSAGTRNIETGDPVTPDTLHHIGSISKVLNATLVLQLVDEGHVDLDANVREYLPELRLRDEEALARISVRMLLNHTSGIDGAMLPDHGHDEETIEKGIARFSQLGQVHQPGAEFSYCNPATVIAGYLAQRVASKSWYSLVRERIYEPLGMTHAATLPEEAILQRAAVGHYLDPKAGKLARASFAFLPMSFAPAGAALMMSAHDLLLFAEAHMNLGMAGNGARILSEASAREMQKVSVDNEGKGYTLMDMGLGWMVTADGLLHHGGSAPGGGALLYAYPDQRWAVSMMFNSNSAFGLITEILAPLLAGRGATKPLGAADTPTPLGDIGGVIADYAGCYEDVLMQHEVTAVDGVLKIRQRSKSRWFESVSTEPTPISSLLPVGEDQFIREALGPDDWPATFRMFAFRDRDENGRFKYLGNGSHLYRRVDG